MGSTNLRCALSGTTIYWGDPCRVAFIHENPFQKDIDNELFPYADVDYRWVLASPFYKSKYEDYGRLLLLENVDSLLLKSYITSEEYLASGSGKMKNISCRPYKAVSGTEEVKLGRMVIHEDIFQRLCQMSESRDDFFPVPLDRAWKYLTEEVRQQAKVYRNKIRDYGYSLSDFPETTKDSYDLSKLFGTGAIIVGVQGLNISDEKVREIFHIRRSSDVLGFSYKPSAVDYQHPNREALKYLFSSL